MVNSDLNFPLISLQVTFGFCWSKTKAELNKMHRFQVPTIVARDQFHWWIGCKMLATFGCLGVLFTITYSLDRSVLYLAWTQDELYLVQNIIYWGNIYNNYNLFCDTRVRTTKGGYTNAVVSSQTLPTKTNSHSQNTWPRNVREMSLDAWNTDWFVHKISNLTNRKDVWNG